MTWTQGSHEKEQDDIARIPLDKLEQITQQVIDRTEEIDLKSFTDWHKDPDCDY